MSDDWLQQLSQLHEADKAKRKAEAKQPPEQRRQHQAADLLRQSKAHTLLREVQKVFLGGKGLLDVFESAGQYDRGISLVWQGPISAARKPNPNDPEAYQYILVGVRQGKLWVNGKPVPSATPEALKIALLEACKNPERAKRNK